jgi:histidinol-phosphate aminotransferase
VNTTTGGAAPEGIATLAAGLVARKSPDRRINLSSNELRHPVVQDVLRDAWPEVSPLQALGYPRNAEDVREIGTHFGLDPSEFQLTPGSDVALRLICARARHLFPDGPRLLLQSPNYPAWEEAAAHHRIPVHRVGPLDGDVSAQVAELVAAARSSAPGLIAVSAPNGPVGWGIAQRDLDELQRAAEDGGHLLVLDACYQAFAGPLRGALARRGDHVVVVQTLSKSHGLAGARVSLLATSAARLAVLGSTSLEQAVSGTSMALATAVLRRESLLRPVWAEVVRMRAEAARRLAGLGLQPLDSQANFLTVRVGAGAGALASQLATAHYRVREFHDPGGHLDGCLRFTITDQVTCERFLDVVAEAVGGRSAWS